MLLSSVLLLQVVCHPEQGNLPRYISLLIFGSKQNLFDVLNHIHIWQVLQLVKMWMLYSIGNQHFDNSEKLLKKWISPPQKNQKKQNKQIGCVTYTPWWCKEPGLEWVWYWPSHTNVLWPTSVISVRNHENIFAFSIISQLWDGAGTSIFSSWKTKNCSSNIYFAISPRKLSDCHWMENEHMG